MGFLKYQWFFNLCLLYGGITMIFDFRLRPPYKGFKNLGIFNPACNEKNPSEAPWATQ